MKNEKAKPLHVRVAEKLIEQLKAGTAPWQKPWSSDHLPAFELPYNAQTGNRYKGINTLSLLLTPYNDPRWLTFNQASANEWQVKKGEKGTMIQFVKLIDLVNKRDEKGESVVDEFGKPIKVQVNLKNPIIKSAWVFNAEQINGIPELKKVALKELGWNPIERAEQLVKNSGAKIVHVSGDNAFYNFRADNITLPLREQFDTPDKYYATALHELGHWTGHKDRLDRSLMNKHGSEEYAREELRAEIASLLIGQELKIGHDPSQHTAYVESWIKVLQDNPFEVHLAAADAEKIFNYLLAFEQKRELGKPLESIATRPARSKETLLQEDEIAYNDTIYKVQRDLKKGKFQMEDMQTGTRFLLSHTDGLYTSLLNAKQENSLALKLTAEPQSAPKEESLLLKDHSFKR